MEKDFNYRLAKVQSIIKNFDDFNIVYSQAINRFNEGNKLLDECLEIINKENFKVDEI